MAHKKTHHEEAEKDKGAAFIKQLSEFWNKNSKPLFIVLGALVVIVGGFLLYKEYVQKPKYQEAQDKSFKAEEYFRMDSVALALSGDGVNPGFIKIADKYSGTPAGNMAQFYAGVCCLKLNQNDKAVKYLKDFSTDAKQIQQRAYKLLGDAYGDLGKGEEALKYYKKAAYYNTDDKTSSANALFHAAFLAQKVLNKPDEAIKLYKEIKEKYGQTQQGFMADQYLAQLGVYNVN